MGSISEQPNTELCVVVTGANRGIGLAIAGQLAEKGVTVVLTARNENCGVAVIHALRQGSNICNVMFHQLDVQDPVSVSSLVKFVETQFGKLDILLSGKAANIVQEFIRQTYDDAVTCFDINYHGCKRVTEAFLPLLKKSDSDAKIVNLSSVRGELKRIPSEKTRSELANIDNLNEAIIENMLQRFLKDMKDGNLEDNGWPTIVPTYSISKAALNAYTRILAKRNPDMHINCVHPGFVKTDLNFNTGIISTEEGAKGAVMLALIANNGVTGCYFDQTRIAEY